MPETETNLMIQLIFVFFGKKKSPVEMKLIISATKATLKAQAALKFNVNNLQNKIEAHVSVSSCRYLLACQR